MKNLNVILVLAIFFALFGCQKEAMKDLSTSTKSSNTLSVNDLYKELTPQSIEASRLELQEVMDQNKSGPTIEGMPFAEGRELPGNSRSTAIPMFIFKSKIAGHCVDVKGGNLANNNPIWQYVPNQTAAQIWIFYDAGGGYYYIKSKVSNKYLTVKDGSKNAMAPIVQHSYSSALAYAQQWNLVHSGDGDYYYFVNRNSGMVLDVQYASNANGTILWQYPFNGSVAQKFKYEKTTYERPRYSRVYGGAGGGAFNLLPQGGMIDIKKVSRLFIRHGSLIDAVQVEWELMGGEKVWSPRAGGAGGTGTYVTLEADEYIMTVSGRSAQFVNQLTFYTNKGRTFGPFGGNGGTAFSLSVSEGIKGFHGKSGSLVDNIGITH